MYFLPQAKHAPILQAAALRMFPERCRRRFAPQAQTAA